MNDTVMWLGRSQFTSENNANADYYELRIYSHALGTNEINFSRVNGPDTYLAPPPQASNLTMATNANTLVLAWTPGAGSTGSVLVMHAVTATSLEPNYATNDTGSATFGNGANLGLSNYVVFAGSGSTVTVTNLLPGQKCFAAVYAYSGSGTNTVYNLADEPTANLNAPGVVQSIALTTSSPMAWGGTPSATVLATYNGGSVVDVTVTNPVRSVFLNISNQLSFDNSASDGKLGFLGMDFHPGFATNAASYWKTSIAANTAQVAVGYRAPSNLGNVIEASTDLLNWTTWNVPGNDPIYGLLTTTNVLVGTVSTNPPLQFFRVKFIEP